MATGRSLRGPWPYRMSKTPAPCPSVKVGVPAGVPHQIDGDLGGEGDVDYEVTPRQVRIITP